MGGISARLVPPTRMFPPASTACSNPRITVSSPGTNTTRASPAYLPWCTVHIFTMTSSERVVAAAGPLPTHRSLTCTPEGRVTKPGYLGNATFSNSRVLGGVVK